MQLLCHLNICEYRYVYPGAEIWNILLLICIFKYLEHSSKYGGALFLILQFLPGGGKLGNIWSIIRRLGKNFLYSARLNHFICRSKIPIF